MSTLGKRIRAVRGKRSQTVFAASLGVSKGALVSYELDRSSPNAKILMAICRLEQVDIKWLLTGDGTKYQENAEESVTGVPLNNRAESPIQLPVCPHCRWMEQLIDKLEEDRQHLLLENRKLLLENTVLHSRLHPIES